MTTPNPATIAYEAVETYVGDSDTSDGFDHDDLLAVAAAAIRADRAQREGQEVFVILSEEGDLVDVTTSREWAEWQTRQGDDNAIRTFIQDTLWSGPEDREDWA